MLTYFGLGGESDLTVSMVGFVTFSTVINPLAVPFRLQSIPKDIRK